MPKDQRLYAKFTLDFPEHEKVLPLSDAAFRCLVEATIWSRKQMTDGWLASRLAVAKWGLDVLQELSTNDPDSPSLIASETGWQIRDFEEHQDTRAEIEARRERNKLNGQKGGIAKGKRGAKQPASESLSENLAETETETHRSTTAKAVVGQRKPGRRPKPRTYIAVDYLPEMKTIDAIRAEFPHATSQVLEYQTRKFRDHWAKVGKSMADWDATWRNWIRTADERGELSRRNGVPASTTDQRVAQAQALKLVVPDGRMELE